MQTHPLFLLDASGQPLPERLHEALATLARRLQRKFPALSDACMLTEVLEETGQRIAAREDRRGPLEDLESYLWTVACRMAALRLSQDEWLATAMLGSDPHERVVDALPSVSGTPDQIEAQIFYRQLATLLTPAEQLLLRYRQSGLSVREIATRQGISVVRASSAWRRVKRKLHDVGTSTGRQRARVARKKPRR